MAIDDNTTYGLTGAQVKELPERINAVKGLAKVLTTDDYNYPVDNPNSIALWLLEPGIYMLTTDGSLAGKIRVTQGNSDSEWSQAGRIYIITKNDIATKAWTFTPSRSYMDLKLLLMEGNHTTFTQRWYVRDDEISNNLVTTVQNRVLDARQGKVLNDKIGGDLSNLTTTDKTSLINAINEVAGQSGAGGVTELTSTDYNYPTNNPDGVALWLLNPGIYYIKSSATYYLYSSGHATVGVDGTYFMVWKDSSDNVYIYRVANGGQADFWKTTSAGVSSANHTYLTDYNIVSSTGTSTTNVMSQNAVTTALSSKADTSAIPTATSDLTNDGSDGTSTYVETDELASVATSGSYNDLSDKPTIPTVPTVVSAFTNDAGYQTASQVNTAVGVETTARQSADNNLQQQIDAISASSDVKDIVGTKAELNNYDTTTLGNNDIIKVLQDESQNGETTYYRWSTTTSTFTLIGEEGPYYTKSEADALLNAKANISSLATVATSGSYNDLTNKPTIPTVNDATLTIQANGTTVNTFTANASSNVTANIPSATTSRYGVTQLSDSTSSTSTALAATSSAVKSAYDLAETKAKITMSSTDPGEGATLAAGKFIAVYDSNS